MSGQTLRLTEKEIPNGTLIALFHDLHIPHHDKRALKAARECADAEGASVVILDGDIADSGVVSRHEGKRQKDVIDWGSLKLSCAKGRDMIDWARAKKACYYIRGNHEAWVEKKIELDAGLRGAVTPEQLMGWPESGDGWTVLPSLSRIKIGSLTIEHLDGFFKTGSGGVNPAKTILRRAPNQTTVGGHLHREDFACHTMQNEFGIDQTRCAYVGGHMSEVEQHEDYMGTYPGWQQGWKLIRVFWIDGRAKYTIYPIIIFRDAKNRPSFEFNGRQYRG